MNETNPAEGTNPQEAAAAASMDTSEALAAASARATENRESYLRAVADLENFRKRSERDIENARKFAIERFAQELVPVSDALEAGINAGSAGAATALMEGAQATLRQLYRAFDKGGIKIIDPAPGQPFDPEWHEAMTVQESREHPVDTVLSVIQRGYSLNGRLLRAARVIVVKAPDGKGN